MSGTEGRAGILARDGGKKLEKLMDDSGTKSDLVINYLRRFPKAGSLTLAKTIYSGNKLLFTNIECVRLLVRRQRQAAGKYHRDHVHTDEFKRTPEEIEQKKLNPYGLPQSCSDDWKPIKFPIKKGRGLILADAHIPYHDVNALTLAIEWAHKNAYCDFVLFMGDMQDHYALSKFQKNPKARKFKEEILDMNIFLDAIQKEFTSAQIIYQEGNHENRLKKYLMLKAPEIFDMEEFLWSERLEFKKRGIIHVNYDVPMQAGKLNILHELRGSSSTVNPARGAYLKSLECIIIAHHHRTSQHAETSFSRRLDTAWSIGCTCCLWPDWARINKWNHGCAGLEVDGKDFEVQNMRIITSEGIVR